MKNIIYFATAVAILSEHAMAGEALFTNDTSIKTIKGSIPINRLANTNVTSSRIPFAGDPSVLSSRSGLKINPNAVKAEQIELSLPDGEKIVLKKVNRHTTYTGSTVWVGADIKAKPGIIDATQSLATLALRNGKMTGSIHYKGQYYRIEAAQDGNHSLAKIRPNPTIADHSEKGYRDLPRIVMPRNQLSIPSLAPTGRPELAEYDNEVQPQKSASRANSLAAPTYAPVVRVLINYTPAAQTGIPDMRATIDTLLASANTALAQAHSTTRLTLAYSAPVSYTEKTGLGTDQNVESDRDAYSQAYNFDGSNPNLAMREVKSQRDLYGADIGIILTNASGEKRCGLAGSIGSNSSTAIAAVDIVCANQYFSLIHEIGHLIGARHGMEEDSTLTPFPHGHGYKTGSTNKDIGSIMSRKIPDVSDHKRWNMFSDPTATYKLEDGRTGSFGTSDKEDNARVTREASAPLANFAPPPTSFPNERDYYIIGSNATDFTIAKFEGLASGSEPEYVPRSSSKVFIFKDMTVNLEIAAKARSIPIGTLNSLVELYIAFFNRVPDAEGLGYWIDEVKRGQTLSQIADNFYTAAILYSDVTGYSASMTNNDFVRIVYKNVLRRDLPANDEGVMYWTNQLSNGSVTRAGIITQILASARTFYNDATYGWVPRLLDNKIVVGKVFSIKKGLSYRLPELSITKGMAIAAAVTDTDTDTAIGLIAVRDINFVVP